MVTLKSHNLGIEVVDITKVSEAGCGVVSESVAVEEPLEIRLRYNQNGSPTEKCISLTMRSPGNDFELAAGFLFTEGILNKANQIVNRGNLEQSTSISFSPNSITLLLCDEVAVDMQRLERHFYTTSSCGICGKTSIAALQTKAQPLLLNPEFKVASEIIHNLPETQRKAQDIYEQTGGLHAAALFDKFGKLIYLREDVGRHNALDKLVGVTLLAGCLPLSECILLLSGRASFELIQKAIMAGIPVVAAVGAPSSLAVQLAKQFNITLLGFVRSSRFNIYSGWERIVTS